MSLGSLAAVSWTRALGGVVRNPRRNSNGSVSSRPTVSDGATPRMAAAGWLDDGPRHRMYRLCRFAAPSQDFAILMPRSLETSRSSIAVISAFNVVIVSKTLLYARADCANWRIQFSHPERFAIFGRQAAQVLQKDLRC